MMHNQAQTLVARLISHRWLPRTDEMVAPLITNEEFRQNVLSRLESCGLRLLENPFSDHVAIGLAPQVTDQVMGQDTHYLSNNFNLPKDAVALLVILWALLIIPKRQRQYSAGVEEEPQMSFLPSPVLVTVRDVEKPIVRLSALINDFGRKLGGKSRININLKILKRHGFITMRGNDLMEGPILDLALDYDFLGSRIIDGTLGDLLRDPDQSIDDVNDDKYEEDDMVLEGENNVRIQEL
ncbi:hypothetical protein HTZ97_07280 [Desulfuromonas acetoxidans]|uniref:Uncharacterized protein n=1 Tax=Desulfuromonas acetoxidans (strain DSM 684 / 11070) TaxID=281689 RepID=Q1K3L3_DESA6|nr:hypothetical protein [Desulfuromonas acetoxidans]EAT16961.1 conserved hypothetical protein [Desulfuromonas acetoxidans DSM 684]MBF0644508.1 hypothetical protein [Desulfuromonas acetoxidans]NVD23965.1 hypothetical protein [Desulfuromonas acetoxidans]NVE16262.1 hypothetical protein [Desulfuromonas acetoxidans]